MKHFKFQEIAVQLILDTWYINKTNFQSHLNIKSFDSFRFGSIFFFVLLCFVGILYRVFVAIWNSEFVWYVCGMWWFLMADDPRTTRKELRLTFAKTSHSWHFNYLKCNLVSLVFEIVFLSFFLSLTTLLIQFAKICSFYLVVWFFLSFFSISLFFIALFFFPHFDDTITRCELAT